MTFRHTAVAILLAVALGISSCAGPKLPPRAPGDAPDIASDEAGLWMEFDDQERKFATSGLVINDPVVQEYVDGIACRLSADHCADLRIYVVDVPIFNANMAPNGSMQVWTGLLLRTQNEAQVAAVIAHEIGHFIERHSLEQHIQQRDSSSAAMFFGLATAVAGVPTIGQLGHIVAVGSQFSFSREQERQADDTSIHLMAKAGYDTREAADIWRSLIEERDAGDVERPSLFFASHPQPEERIVALDTLAEELVPDGGGDAGTERFHEIVLPHRAAWMRGLFRLRDFDGHRVVIDRMFDAGRNIGEVHFFDGEYYRLRREEGDAERAAQAYEKAISIGGAPSRSHRGLGQVYARLGEPEKARQALETYLEHEPEANDRAMIEAEIQQLR